MSDRVVVLGSGYAGSATVKRLEEVLDDEELIWISRDPYHVVLHEIYRAVRNPAVIDHVTINVNRIKSYDTEFKQGEVTGIDREEREVFLEDDESVEYDYLVIGLGSKTAFYGIEGLEEHAYTLKSANDAIEIHNKAIEVEGKSDPLDPGKIVVGGAGLTGIETAGELAEFRDHYDAPVEIELVEAVDKIFLQGDDDVRKALREKLEKKFIQISTGDPITKVDDDKLYYDSGKTEEYDMLIWTGGITGREALHESGLDTEHNRVHTGSTLQTEDPRIFALGDSALIDQMYSDNPAPPTAEAAWEAGGTVAENVKRLIEEQPLKHWNYHNKGTAISVGGEAVCYEMDYIPFKVFNHVPAWAMKKMIGMRWIAHITDWPYALKTWHSL
ncbi:MAG: NAD(P)/FAD-dependent oxidoreductase [Halobacteria archaeon]